jgi:hypothetical protein
MKRHFRTLIASIRPQSFGFCFFRQLLCTIKNKREQSTCMATKKPILYNATPSDFSVNNTYRILLKYPIRAYQI